MIRRFIQLHRSAFTVAFLAGFVFIGLSSRPSAQDVSSAVAKLAADPAVRQALALVKANEAQVIADQIEITQVAAPAFKESTRAALLKKKFEAAGLKDVRIDAAGNVIGVRHGASARPNLVLAAHLDTVFPEGTDVTVKREGAVLKAPGIGDDGRGGHLPCGHVVIAIDDGVSPARD